MAVRRDRNRKSLVSWLLLSEEEGNGQTVGGKRGGIYRWEGVAGGHAKKSFSEEVVLN